MVIRNDYSDYGIPNLRQKSVFDMGQNGMWPQGQNLDPGMTAGSGPINPWMNSPATDASYYDDPHAFESPVTDIGSMGPLGGTQPGMGAPPPITPPRVNTYEPRSETDSLRRFTNAVNSVYSPDFTDRDRLRALMDAAPQREEPGFGRRLTAAAMGFRQKPEDTLKIQEEVMYAPHRRAMTDWTAKTEPFTKIAEIEGRQNVNERTLAGNMVNAVTQGDRIDAQRARDEAKHDVDVKNAESTRIRSEALNFKYRHPDWIFKTDGPNVMAYPPDGSGPGVNLGPSGHMTEIDKIELQNKGKKEAAEAGGRAYWQTPGQNGEPAQTGVYNPRTDGPVPPPGSRPMAGAGSRSTKEESPADYDKRQQIEWKEARLKSDKVQRWTEFKGNNIQMKAKPTMGSWLQSDAADAADIKEWEEVRDELLHTNTAGSSNVAPSRPPDQANSRTQQENAGTVKDRGVAAGVNGRQKAADVTKPPPPPKEAGPTAWTPPPGFKGNIIGAPRGTGNTPIYGGRGAGGSDLPEFNKPYEEPPTDQGATANIYNRGAKPPRSSDINLPMTGTPGNPAHTDEQMQSAIDYQNLRQRAISQLTRDKQQVTEKRIDWLISSGQLGNGR